VGCGWTAAHLLEIRRGVATNLYHRRNVLEARLSSTPLQLPIFHDVRQPEARDGSGRWGGRGGGFRGPSPLSSASTQRAAVLAEDETTGANDRYICQETRLATQTHAERSRTSNELIKLVLIGALLHPTTSNL